MFSDICEQLHIQVSVQRGSCDYLDGVFGVIPPIVDEYYVHRDLIVYDIKFQNCSGYPWRITEANLSFENKFLLIDASTGVETVLNQMYLLSSANNSILHSPPLARILAVSVDEQCGVFNDQFTGGLPGFDAGSQTYSLPANTKLFKGPFVVDSGECCIQLIVAVDQVVTSGEVAKPLVVERACLSTRGQVTFDSEGVKRCSQVQKSVLLPGDCALRLDRLTFPPIDSPSINQ